jgi:hypothetical protein
MERVKDVDVKVGGHERMECEVGGVAVAEVAWEAGLRTRREKAGMRNYMHTIPHISD